MRRDFGLLNARTTFRTLIERDQFDFREASGTDFLVGGVRNLSAAGNRNSASLEEEIRATGYLWDTAFNYDDKFIATGLFRYDGSSLFGEDERWQPYYRAAGAYRLGQGGLVRHSERLGTQAELCERNGRGSPSVCPPVRNLGC